MTAQQRDRKADLVTELLSFPVAAATTIYGGAMVAIDASGNAVPAAADATLRVRGMCLQAITNAGAAGLAIVQVRRGPIKVFISASDIVAADVGTIAYVLDDQTVAKSSSGGTRPPAGKVIAIISTTQVVVDLDTPSLYDVPAADVTPAAVVSALGAAASAVGINGQTFTAGDIVDSGLTASQYVKTDGSKKLVSSATVTIGDLTVASQAQGDVLYHNGTTWVRLAAGTAGLALITGGAGANPAWGSDFGASNIVTTGTLGAGATTVSRLNIGGGTQPTTGLLRFPKPSEQSVLAVFRREASAVDIPFLTTDTTSALFVGDVASGTFGTLAMRSSSAMVLQAPTILLREGDVGAATRATWTVAAATTLNMAASTSLAIQNNGTVRFTTVNAKPSISGALSAVVDANAKAVLTSIIAALKVTTGIDVATDGTT